MLDSLILLLLGANLAVTGLVLYRLKKLSEKYDVFNDDFDENSPYATDDGFYTSRILHEEKEV